MPKLLRIDSSARRTHSHSRTVGDAFEAAWSTQHGTADIVRRDLVLHPVPHISDTTITGYYTPPQALTPELKQATALSDLLIAELKAADVVLLTVPMYNFSIPSVLKAWVDHIVRINHTFSYDGQSFTGLVTGKAAYIACAYGAAGYTGDGPMVPYNMVQSYLDTLLRFLGFTDITFIGVEGTTGDAATVAAHAAQAQKDATRLAQSHRA